MDIGWVISSAQIQLGYHSKQPLVSDERKAVLEVYERTTARLEAEKKPNVHYAMKVVFLGGKHAEAAQERGQREVEALKSVTSPNVVKVVSQYETTFDPGCGWVEELLPGQDVSEQLSEPIDWKKTKRLLEKVAAGLAAFHKLEFVYGDLSAGSVRSISPSGYKLMSPGISRNLVKMAKTGKYEPGTPGYRSPDKVLTAASDVYSAGVLGYRALSGVMPSGVKYKPLKSLADGLSKDVVALIDQCLQPKPEKRFVDGAALLKALKELG